jgi:hypothetical protein
MLLCAVAVLAGASARAETIALSAECCCAPAANCNNPDGPNAYVPLDKKICVATGSKDVYIPRTMLHYPTAQLGKSVVKAELKITKDSVANCSKDRRTTDPFPTDIILEHIEFGVKYPHDPYGKGDYWIHIGTEWNNPALGVPGNILLVKAGTNLANTPITVDVTRMVNEDLEAERKVITFRVRALNSKGDGFFAYMEDPQLVVETAPAK